jgi:hypothetical protein
MAGDRGESDERLNPPELGNKKEQPFDCSLIFNYILGHFYSVFALK